MKIANTKKNAAEKHTCANASSKGNFGAFANTRDATRLASVGGFGHDATFEAIFAPNGGLNAVAAANFVKSATKLVKDNNLDGIDLDYEKIEMTVDESKSYLALIKELRAGFNAAGLGTKKITLTILSDPAY